jgi:uncharacterized DUF497 family protein
MEVHFTWDEQKAANNLQKHEVSFAEAQTVFNNPLAVLFDDEVHSAIERREIIIGLSARNRLVLVCFTEQGGIVRILSARCAIPKERRDYEENTGY